MMPFYVGAAAQHMTTVFAYGLSFGALWTDRPFFDIVPAISTCSSFRPGPARSLVGSPVTLQRSS
jgi:hypothetical protein